MRFLKLFPVCALLFGLVSLVGCPSGGDDGSYICGDGVCEVGNGESEFNCAKDCASSRCGDGTCDSGETTQNCSADCPTGPVCGDHICNGSETSSSCPGDCPLSQCTDPNFPVNCNDDSGVCWSPGTNCASDWFVCSGKRRCLSTSDWAFCCFNTFLTCPASHPYYCPQDGLCYQTVPNCSTSNVCTLVLGDC